VAYEYQEIDGARTATGHVQMSMKEYKNLEKVPELPHGICLLATLTLDGDPILAGVMGDDLNSRVAKYRKGQRRSEAVGGLINRTIEPTMPPPWLVGKAR
jgi:hypothetical protein